MDSLNYISGFKNHHATEAKPGALPVGQNSPQKVPHGLYAEQLSGTAFTTPRDENLRTWLYRIRPSVIHKAFEPVRHDVFQGEPWKEVPTPPDQMRWFPMKEAQKPTDFISGLECMVGNGEVGQSGSAIYHYSFNQSMSRSYFYSADGEMIFVPHHGDLLLRTECGTLQISPTEIGVVPRGMKFQVQTLAGAAMGYICENFGEPFRLPSLGPIGANGLANARDFLYPVAAYENKTEKGELYCKFNGLLYRSEIGHSPLDVVAWHGNYAPYKYDLKRFNTINTVSFDHPDPSIFTVLTSPSGLPGVANVDFVIFPPRWMVAENTFRPPYYHRNYMNEYMGLIRGIYDAKAEGFLPGGASLHNRMTGHGPDAATFEKASSSRLQPEYYGDTLAFMFESHRIYRPTARALQSDRRDRNYLDCWQGLQTHFKD